MPPPARRPPGTPARSRHLADLLRPLLAHALARGLDPDDANASAIHRQIIERKPLLRDVYDEWYRELVHHIGEAAPVLEIGSGAGYLASFLRGLITSDVRPTPATRVVLDAHCLPFRNAALGAIAMTNVIHHLPSASAFFREAARVVRPGGLLVAIEPWVSRWSSFVFSRLHHEPFDPTAVEWEFPPGGPLSAANGALPWILFDRDRRRFEREHPAWRIERIHAGWPLRYVMSGGVSMRSLAPRAARGLLRRLDRRLERRPERWAMFALIVLRRDELPPSSDGQHPQDSRPIA